MLSKIVRNSSNVYKKISITSCKTTRYADFGGERGILYHSTIFCNSLIFKCRL